MKLFNLPQDIFPSKVTKPEGIIIHDYSAHIGSFKGKSILHTNAISLVISGEKTMHFAEKKLVITDNTFHFLSAGNCLASMDLSRTKTFRSVLIFFDNKILTDFYLKYHLLIQKLQQKHPISPEAYVSFNKDGFVYNFIDSLLLLNSSGTLSEEMKRLKFEELLLHLLDTEPQKVLSFQSSPKNELEDLEIKKVVETNLLNNVTVEELAFLCNMSLSTFKRRFTKLYNSSPNKWILQQRMEKAKHLLSHYNEKPSEVFYKVGYENHSSFSQSFRASFGMSPKDFQLQHLNKQQQLLNQKLH